MVKNAHATAVILKTTGEVIDYRRNNEVNLVEGIHIHKDFLTGNGDAFQILRNADTGWN